VVARRRSSPAIRVGSQMYNAGIFDDTGATDDFVLFHWGFCEFRITTNTVMITAATAPLFSYWALSLVDCLSY
jgi:hypothetical protein